MVFVDARCAGYVRIPILMLSGLPGGPTTIQPRQSRPYTRAMSFLSRLLASKAAPKRRIDRDVVQVELADGRCIDVLRVRDARARRLRVAIDERGVRLTLPARASAVSGDRFLHEHRDWIAMQLAQNVAYAIPALVAHVTPTLLLRGLDRPLQWSTARTSRFATGDVTLDADIVVNAHAPASPSSASLARALRDFYETEARSDINRWLPHYLGALPRPPARTRFKIMASQWGSLAPDGAMALDLSLVLARPSAFHYVLVHELCHLIHADHSRRFWGEVEARCPHWRDERAYLHSEGRRLKATLRALVMA